MLNQDLRKSPINTHKTKISGWLYYPFRLLISNIMECHLRVVGLVRSRNIQSSIPKMSLTDRFPIPYLATFPEFRKYTNRPLNCPIMLSSVLHVLQ
jgi:hypothetical protein